MQLLPYGSTAVVNAGLNRNILYVGSAVDRRRVVNISMAENDTCKKRTGRNSLRASYLPTLPLPALLMIFGRSLSTAFANEYVAHVKG